MVSMEKYKGNPILELIQSVERGDKQEAAVRCKTALLECGEVEDTINLTAPNSKAVKDIKEFIEDVKRKNFKSTNKQLGLARDAFKNHIIPHYERYTRGYTKGKPKQTEVPEGTERNEKRSFETRGDVQAIAKRYAEIYDGIWPDAHDQLVDQRKDIPENEKANLLLEIVQRAFKLCEEEARDQLLEADRCARHIVKTGKFPDRKQNIPVEDTVQAPVELLKRFRYLNASLAVPRLKQTFLEGSMKAFYKKYQLTQHKVIDQYAASCVDVTWFLCTGDPPVHIVFENNSGIFDGDMYKACTKKGRKIDYIVWPPLLHYKNGPVLARGIAECKN